MFFVLLVMPVPLLVLTTITSSTTLASLVLLVLMFVLVLVFVLLLTTRRLLSIIIPTGEIDTPCLKLNLSELASDVVQLEFKLTYFLW